MAGCRRTCPAWMLAEPPQSPTAPHLSHNLGPPKMARTPLASWLDMVARLGPGLGWVRVEGLFLHPLRSPKPSPLGFKAENEKPLSKSQVKARPEGFTTWDKAWSGWTLWRFFSQRVLSPNSTKQHEHYEPYSAFTRYVTRDK